MLRKLRIAFTRKNDITITAVFIVKVPTLLIEYRTYCEVYHMYFIHAQRKKLCRKLSLNNIVFKMIWSKCELKFCVVLVHQVDWIKRPCPRSLNIWYFINVITLMTLQALSVSSKQHRDKIQTDDEPGIQIKKMIYKRLFDEITATKGLFAMFFRDP